MDLITGQYGDEGTPVGITVVYEVGGGGHQWRNEPKHLGGGAIFARERSDQARGSEATKRGEGVSPSHGRELFHFST